MKLLVAAVIGTALGSIFAHLVFLGGFLTLGVWGVAGTALGFIAKNKKEALLLGGIFGFVVSLVFLIADYQGSIAVVYRLFPFALLSCVGFVGGLVLGIGGFFLKKLTSKK